MKHREINPDEAIDRVLTGLREVEPPQEMQQRVLAAARERASTRRRWDLQLPIAAASFWAVAAASVTVIALAASWAIVRSHRTTHETAHSAVHRVQADTSIAETQTPPAPIAATRHAREVRRSSSERQTAPVEPVSGEESLALSEMNAPSHPAPPMPLTEQEKLLLRMIHKGDPVELAMLDPKMRSSEEADGKAEFERFFAPPPTTSDIKPLTGEDK